MNRSVDEQITKIVSAAVSSGPDDCLHRLERAFFKVIQRALAHGLHEEEILVAFAAAGVHPLSPSVPLGRAARPIAFRVPPCEAGLARLAGFKVQDRASHVWVAPIGSSLTMMERWLPEKRRLALRAARGVVQVAVRVREPNYAKDDFVAKLHGASRWVESVAEMLRAKGCEVEVPEVEVRADVEDIARFSQHEVDIILKGCRFGLEVKSRYRAWTTPADFEFETMFVDTLTGYLSKAIRPLAYICISTQTSAIAVIPPYTAASWTCSTRKDSTRESTDERPVTDRYLECPRHLLKDLDWLVSLCRDLDAEADPVAVMVRYGYPRDLAQRMARRVYPVIDSVPEVESMSCGWI